MKLYITANTSKKTNKIYTALVAETNTGKWIVSFDKIVLLRVSGKSLFDIESLKDGERIDIA